MIVATRAIDFRSFIVMDVLERANVLERAGHDIIHLEIGEPDFDTPQCIKEAGIKAIREGKTHYTHSLGSDLITASNCSFGTFIFKPTIFSAFKAPLRSKAIC